MFTRRLTLADVARYTDPKSLINRTVFDLDSAVSAEGKEVLSEAVTQDQQPQGGNMTLAGHEATVASQCEPSRVQSLPVSMITCQSSLTTRTDVTRCHGSYSPKTESSTTPKKESGGCEEVPHLWIDSRFESGNLQKAIQVSYQYTCEQSYRRTLQLHVRIATDKGG